MRRLLLAIGLLLVIAPAAHAGGWATVELSSTPAGTAPGAPWDVNITVLQHGVTPLNDLNPAVTIANGDATKTFAAKATDKPGVYAASADSGPNLLWLIPGITLLLAAVAILLARTRTRRHEPQAA